MTNEETYLGQLLMHNELLHDTDVRVTDFTSPRCKQAFTLISHLINGGNIADLKSVYAMDATIDAGWLAGLTTDFTPNTGLIAGKVIEDGRRYRLGMLVRTAAEDIEREPVGTVLERLEEGLTELGEGRGGDVILTKDIALEKMQEFERRHKSHGDIPGLATGLPDLDMLILGFEPAKLYVVGGRPGEGKSALLLNFAIETAKRYPVGIISIENSASEVMERAFASIGGVKGDRMRRGTFATSDFTGLSEAASFLTDHTIVIADKPNMSLVDLRSRARRMVRQYGIRLLLVDYVQLIQVDGEKTDYERVSKCSIALKQLARELDIPVVTAAQLNRGASQGEDRQPRLSDFKNTGQIEQDADVAMLLWNRGEEMLLCVEKNRDGATSAIQVYFDKATYRFRGHTRTAA